MSLRYEYTAGQALEDEDSSATLFDRIQSAMRRSGMDPKEPYHMYRVARHVGELLVRDLLVAEMNELKRTGP